MPVYVINGHRVWFSHIPKTAGSSIHAALGALASEVDLHDDTWTRYWRRGGGWRDPDRRSSPQHMTWREAQDRLGPALPALRFAVCRDPVARLQSEFKYQAQRSRARRRITRFGFPAWLRMSLAAARHDPSYMDNHFRPQVEFFDDSFRVFPLEQGLGAVFDWIGHETGARVPTDIPVLKKSTQPAIRLASSDIALIEARYGADFRALGYPASAAEAAPEIAGTLLQRAAGRMLARLYASGNL
ncbi:sulfotransferase family 2 domain-containing protein [Roseicyclus persicicus]|uniref:Sulfotransferase family protein n=1 Tax=Roseicyclus persicicus TaxID=2650661 RepID=A0A7X6JZ25_9RHOB|nr:sulfotransferase family 2 domain-containing protein [Roseibacterium persicicum]NKX44725.1 sulfotransferase family protein [Roseibacterium persicicum]